MPERDASIDRGVVDMMPLGYNGSRVFQGLEQRIGWESTRRVLKLPLVLWVIWDLRISLS